MGWAGMSKDRKQEKLQKTAEAVDVEVAHAVAPFRKTLPVRVLAAGSELGDQPQMIALSAAVLGAGFLRRDPRMARAGARMLAAHWLATWSKNFIKKRVDRTRPRQVVEGKGSPKLRKGRNSAKEETSFPSGHTAGAVAVAQAFARDYPEHGGKARVGAALIAAAQIPRCAHYPTDVGVGAVIGIAAEAAVSAAFAAGEKAFTGQR